ncbi:DUF1403 family protein [Mesorhizobium sp. M1169]|uniref:DUF1403 family protein n=1 Tax=Mesorhizobium sp. M1169 TaxID=2957066 RepID=UPI0033369926
MIRAPTSPFVALATPTVSGWAIPHGPVATDAAAAVMAGAALNALDVLVRSDPPRVGAWRQRLALRNAVAAVRLAGRIEDEAALRDVWNLPPPGADLSAIGPAGGWLLGVGSYRGCPSSMPTCLPASSICSGCDGASFLLCCRPGRSSGGGR